MIGLCCGCVPGGSSVAFANACSWSKNRSRHYRLGLLTGQRLAAGGFQSKQNRSGGTISSNGCLHEGLLQEVSVGLNGICWRKGGETGEKAGTFSGFLHLLIAWGHETKNTNRRKTNKKAAKSMTTGPASGRFWWGGRKRKGSTGHGEDKTERATIANSLCEWCIHHQRHQTALFDRRALLQRWA